MGISAQQWNNARAAREVERSEQAIKQWQTARARQFNRDVMATVRTSPRKGGTPPTFTYLQLACRAADLPKVREILALGFSPNTTGPFLWTALHVTAMAYASTAADRKRATLNNIAQLLLDNGADVTARDAMGLTPMACSNGVVPPAIRAASLAAFKPEPDTTHGAGDRQYRVMD